MFRRGYEPYPSTSRGYSPSRGRDRRREGELDTRRGDSLRVDVPPPHHSSFSLDHKRRDNYYSVSFNNRINLGSVECLFKLIRNFGCLDNQGFLRKLGRWSFNMEQKKMHNFTFSVKLWKFFQKENFKISGGWNCRTYLSKFKFMLKMLKRQEENIPGFSAKNYSFEFR